MLGVSTTHSGGMSSLTNEKVKCVEFEGLCSKAEVLRRAICSTEQRRLEVRELAYIHRLWLSV